jgi:SAM-dependent methyltransferase
MKNNRYSPSIVRYYDAIMKAGYYNHRDIALILQKILKNRKKILELGVGTGLLAKELIKSGYAVSGIDFTKSMIERAEKRLTGRVKLFLQDVSLLDTKEKYDAAISEGGPWLFLRRGRSLNLQSHIKDFEKNISALKRVSDHLNKNGLLALNIQPMHQNIDGLIIGKKLEYSQRIKTQARWIEKEYIVKRWKKRVAYQKSIYRLFSKKEEMELFHKGGFTSSHTDKSGSFMIFRKNK